jgi:anti-sigma-K factor RskA
MSHQEYQDLVAVYALDALDVSEARSLEDHLGTCAECRAELAELRDAGALLACGSTPAMPSDDVRAKIMTAVRLESRPTAKKSDRVVPLVPRASQNAWTNILRLAAAIAFVALLIGIIVMWRRDQRSQREVAQLSQQLEQQQRELTRNSEALALMNSPGATMIPLIGTKMATNARATFVFDKQTGRAMLMTDGLPEAAAGMAYEVWFIPPGRSPMPGQTFTVDSRGQAMMSDLVPADARAKATIAITIEPKGGSAQPTGAIYLVSSSS